MLDPGQVRFLNAERFGEYHGRAEGQVRLSAGGYEGAVSAPGLDPLRLPPFEVPAGELVDLGSRWLLAGGGMIEGVLDAPHLGAGESVTLELFGFGRNRCVACPPEKDGAPCACGYARDKSTLVLKDSPRFSFAGLAAGTYHLRARVAGSHAELRTVVLESRGYAWVNLPLTRQVAVRFALERSSGMPYFERPERNLSSRATAGESEILPVEEVEELVGLLAPSLYSGLGILSSNASLGSRRVETQLKLLMRCGEKNPKGG